MRLSGELLMKASDRVKGIIFDIQKFCVHDGPGIRTTVFLKGCNLRCKWCHNPESMLMQKQLSFNNNKCSLCGECAKVCPNNAHEITQDKHKVNFDKCTFCGICTDYCIEDALKIMGKEVTVNEVLYEVEKDKKYYEESGGGITLSGGEATIQLAFALELMKESKARGIHTCLETNGILKVENFKELLPHVDIILLDFKVTDDMLHEEQTGGSNKQVFESLKLLNDFNKQIVLRCPIIPGINDTEEHFKKIAQLSNEYPCIECVEIMAYHNIGKDKWEQIGENYSFPQLETVNSSIVEKWKSLIRGYGGRVK